MSDLIIVDGDMVNFLPTYGTAIVTSIPTTITSTAERAGDQLSASADRDPARCSSWLRVHRKFHPGGSTPPRPRDILRTGESKFPLRYTAHSSGMDASRRWTGSGASSC